MGTADFSASGLRRHKGVGWCGLWVWPGGSGGEHTFRLPQGFGRIKFCMVLGLRHLFPCWMLAKSYSQLLGVLIFLVLWPPSFIFEVSKHELSPSHALNPTDFSFCLIYPASCIWFWGAMWLDWAHLDNPWESPYFTSAEFLYHLIIYLFSSVQSVLCSSVHNVSFCTGCLSVFVFYFRQLENDMARFIFVCICSI